MSFDIQTIRRAKLDRNNELISIYVDQMKRLEELIAMRQRSAARIQENIDKEDHIRRAEFNKKIYRAHDDAVESPLEIGQRFRVGPDYLEVLAGKDGMIDVKFDNEPGPRISGKHLETLSKVFYFDFPTATRI